MWKYCEKTIQPCNINNNLRKKTPCPNPPQITTYLNNLPVTSLPKLRIFTIMCESLPNVVQKGCS